MQRFHTIGCSAQTRNGGPDYVLPKMEEAEAAGCFFRADTIEELADKLGFTGEDKENFLATVERYNELYDAQEDTDFGKPAYRLSAIRKAPFYGCWLGASLLTTEQGIAINEKGQALDTNNEPMPGLYITGDMSGSFFANNYINTQKVPSSRHVRMDGTPTGKFAAESVRGRQAECAVRRQILSPRGY